MRILEQVAILDKEANAKFVLVLCTDSYHAQPTKMQRRMLSASLLKEFCKDECDTKRVMEWGQ